ncbi:MAG: hypothetical protein JXR73_18770 [Candidatus Omnitrophica bacterium]|nr:hypothetical protein [Candidatus Omnitrophota bacterium]
MTLFRDGQCEPLKRWPEIYQIVGFAFCALFINLVVGLLIAPLDLYGAQEIKQQMIENRGLFFTFFLIVIVAPFTETIYGQWLPLFVARIAKRTPFMQLLWAACWFSILHIPDGFSAILQNFGVGWVLAGSFLFCRYDSWLKSYRVTSIAHAIHNLTVFMIS